MSTPSIPAVIPLVKLLTVGPVGVGKSCLIKRYVEKKFVSKYLPTIIVDYGVRTVEVDGEFFSLNLFDLSGATQYVAASPPTSFSFSSLSEFVGDSNAMLFTFDLSDPMGSLPLLEEILHLVSKVPSIPIDCIRVLVGTKGDVTPPTALEMERYEELCRKHRFSKVFITSAKTSEGVDEMFQFVMERIKGQMKGRGEKVEKMIQEAKEAIESGA